MRRVLSTEAGVRQTYTAGKFGDTSFIVEFAVLHQFFAFHSGVFPFSDLDYGIQCLFQKDKRYEEETETRGIFVLVLEIGEE